MIRLHRRVAAAVLTTFLLIAPNVAFGASRDTGSPKDVRERIVRVIKKIRSIFTPSTLDGPESGGGITPPKP
jgi:hypothetical protein